MILKDLLIVLKSWDIVPTLFRFGEEGKAPVTGKAALRLGEEGRRLGEEGKAPLSRGEEGKGLANTCLRAPLPLLMFSALWKLSVGLKGQLTFKFFYDS